MSNKLIKDKVCGNCINHDKDKNVCMVKYSRYIPYKKFVKRYFNDKKVCTLFVEKP